MSIHLEKYKQLIAELKQKATLVAVSKTKPAEDILSLYQEGQRDFGENYVQELVEKYEALPKDIRWHFIGHLQSNKVKYIAPFVHLVHGVDSEKLLMEINKQAIKNNRVINCLLQVHIAMEETKFGFDENEIKELMLKIENNTQQYSHVKIMGLMGMASFTEKKDMVKNEFESLKKMYDNYAKNPNPAIKFTTLSMGMSGDYTLALEAGSNMVRIGSMLFGARNYKI
ncbi:MAG: YggS family pyridoxal phosphate-dependent enzyme [Bacteroidetes bacterium]|nr:YggS family pyridoxal phosphate-dependent enzyme [Bacteroidota bacterium]MBS1757563.1 YggS family pyridoxal phosphate-dependent enzyme [Bacteroidota bacterium]